MECDRYPENGQGVASGALAWAGGVKRKLGGIGGLRLGPAGAGGARAGLLAPRRRPEPRPSPRAPLPRIAQDSPFMNNMDEITYWIVTKRAPCLAGYENPLRAAASRALRSPSPDPEPKKKKRKLAAEDSSGTTERPNNYLKNEPDCEIISSEKSDTLVSDVDFNIKKSSIQEKNKKMKNQNNARTTLHKKNKLVTSTPKVTSQNLRRSKRKANNNNSHLDSSFEIFNTTTVNGADRTTINKCEPKKFMEKRMSALAGGDHSTKRNSTPGQKVSNGALNGPFEDMSDVSGFTATYIKSTKINSKTPKKIRAKPSGNLTKETRHNAQQKEEKSLIVSINKAINTGDPKAVVFNCSTDSSQNIINLVSIDKDSKPTNIDKSTSLLKFMDSKKAIKENSSKEENGNGINTSFQSTSTTGSRYPKRHKTSTEVTIQDTDPSKHNLRRPSSHSHIKLVAPICVPSETTDVLSRTRSGRSLGVTKHPDNSVFVLSNSTEQVSSVATMNVASPVQDEHRDSQKKKRVSTRSGRARKSLNKTGQSAKVSFREKSGFAACFSDSDDDKPLKPQKYLS